MLLTNYYQLPHKVAIAKVEVGRRLFDIKLVRPAGFLRLWRSLPLDDVEAKVLADEGPDYALA